MVERDGPLKGDIFMGQLEDEIEEASRGRKVPVNRPDDHEFERRMKETEESFEKVNEDRDAHRPIKP
jgi:hypothetical protein